jgi:hypothetical protein
MYVSDRLSNVFAKGQIYTAVALIPATNSSEWSRFLLIGGNGNYAEAYCTCFCPVTVLEGYLK